MKSEMGSATVTVAPVGVPPTDQRCRMVSPNGDLPGAGRVFGETPNTATVTVALPISDCILTAKKKNLAMTRFAARLHAIAKSVQTRPMIA